MDAKRPTPLDVKQGVMGGESGKKKEAVVLTNYIMEYFPFENFRKTKPNQTQYAVTLPTHPPGVLKLKLHLPPGTSGSAPCGFHGAHILVREERQ